MVSFSRPVMEPLLSRMKTSSVKFCFIRNPSFVTSMITQEGQSVVACKATSASSVSLLQSRDPSSGWS